MPTTAPAKPRRKLRRAGRRPAGDLAVLSPAHQQFCHAVAVLQWTQTRAYQEHVALWTVSDAQAASLASRLVSDEKIAQRLSELKAETARALDEKLAGARAAAVDILAEALTQTPRDVLADGMDSAACELRMSKLGPYVAPVDKLGAIDRMAKMGAWNAPEEIHATVGIHPAVDAALADLWAREERDVTPEPKKLPAKARKRKK